MTDRQTLETDLERYRESGDFASQADTLFALGTLASETAFEDSGFHLVQGLYGQAYAAYGQASNKTGQARALKEIAESMSLELWNHDNAMPIEFNHSHIDHILRLALDLSIEAGDLRGQADIHRRWGQETRNRHDEHAAFQQALSCYEKLGDVQMQAYLMTLMKWRPQNQDFVLDEQFYLEQALALYQQIGDQLGEAQVLMELATLAAQAQRFAPAKQLLERSLMLCISLKSHSAFNAFYYLGKLILETEGYHAYHTWQMTILRHLLELPWEDDMHLAPLWIEFARLARKHQDFETARYAYQQADLYLVGFSSYENRADVYWRWGHLEYHALKRPEVGFTLCEMAVSLSSTHTDFERYQKKLDHMRSEMAAHQRKHVRR